jgi:hypothetical protein
MAVLTKGQTTRTDSLIKDSPVVSSVYAPEQSRQCLSTNLRKTCHGPRQEIDTKRGRQAD